MYTSRSSLFTTSGQPTGICYSISLDISIANFLIDSARHSWQYDSSHLRMLEGGKAIYIFYRQQYGSRGILVHLTPQGRVIWLPWITPSFPIDFCRDFMPVQPLSGSHITIETKGREQHLTIQTRLRKIALRALPEKS